MPTYRVKPGHRFGVGKAKGPGDLVELTTAEAAGFLDKLELVEVTKDEPKPGDLAVVGGEAGTPAGAPGIGAPADKPSTPGGDGAAPVANPAHASVLAPRDDENQAPALDLPTLWATQAPGLNPRVVEVMLKHQLAPAVVAGMSDDALLALDGIGPSTLRALREVA